MTAAIPIASAVLFLIHVLMREKSDRREVHAPNEHRETRDHREDHHRHRDDEPHAEHSDRARDEREDAERREQ